MLLALSGAVVAVALAVPAAIAWTSAKPSQPAAAASPSPTAAASPKAGDPPEARLAWARERIRETLAEMSAAMMSGDRAAFTAAAGDTATRAALDQRFRSLRALKIVYFSLALDSGPFKGRIVDGRQEWGFTVALDHCLGGPQCSIDKLLIETTWRDSDDGFRIVGIGTANADQNGPHPWEVSTLTAAVGSRAVVAAPPAYVAQARAFLPVAERAAKIADKYRLDGTNGTYIVYLAGQKEWQTWFGGNLKDWVVGYAIPATERRSDIVLRFDAIASGDAESVMKHEMGHVATLAGRDYNQFQGPIWWATEGIAEHIAWDGRSNNAYDGRQAVRRYLREKQFAGDPAMVMPNDDAADWEIDGAYGIGFYYIRCIADRYGPEKMLAFSEAMLRGEKPAAQAAADVLGGSWPDISKRCLAYTRDAVGA
ncbi:hypothetical protein GCM10009687_40580 [Asanoa iriomotensis]|uniref:Peptidase MA superfamily protein n=1 Tax=Asanoa iriomotensis TaxID=234613 RepID=A0ABQ4BYV1_9ACTN|nr:hypothetical protein Air01nite_17890 [Asanoa iriomotensis]